MGKNKYILKLSIAIIVGILFFIIGHIYSSPRFSHISGIISKNGKTAKYPALLGLNEDKYVIYVSGTAKSAYENIKIILEGEQEMDYNICSYYPPTIDFGYHKFYQFENNTIKNISANENFNLIVSINPKIKIEKESMYYLKFYDSVLDSSLLTVPILFKELINFHIFNKIKRPKNEIRCSKKNETHCSK